METEKILDCGHPVSAHSDITTGYGIHKLGNGQEIKLCYECCAAGDRTRMLEDGKICLYLSSVGNKAEFTISYNAGKRYLDAKEYKISNWPGSLTFKVNFLTKSRHNIARVRYDAWFCGPDGFEWHGVQYGDNTQIIHCRRTKKRLRTA